MNPQIITLKKLGLLNDIEKDIKKFLNSNRGKEFTSYEIAKGFTSTAYAKLKPALKKYKKSGFSTQESFIGSVSSSLEKRGVIKRKIKKCSYLKKNKAAFYII